MIAFVDTSAMVALLDRADPRREDVGNLWLGAIDHDDTLITSNYVALESTAVVQRRFGTTGIQRLIDHLFPELHMEWVTPDDHRTGLLVFRTTGGSGPSLVDTTSFAVMHRLGLTQCIALDEHFRQQGFELLPG